MKPKILLRVGSILMLLHAIGHTMGTMGFGRPHNPRVEAVLLGMRTEHFDFMGRSATIAQFYDGYGILLILVLLFITIELWLMSIQSLRQTLINMGLLLTASAITEYFYFFPLAALFSLLSAICVWMSLYRLSVKKMAFNN